MPYSITGDFINLQLTAHQFEWIVSTYVHQGSYSNNFQSELGNALNVLYQNVEREMGEDFYKTPFY